MRNKKQFKLIAFMILLICMLIMLSVETFAIGEIYDVLPNANQPNATATIKKLNIMPNYAVLEGQTLQMQIEEFDEFVWLDSVEWSSSNENVVSCTKNGEIKGLKEGKAVITVKAKVGGARDSITVYCAGRLNNPKASRIGRPIAWTCVTPFLLNVQALHFKIQPFFVTEKLDVKGVYDSYFYVEFTRNEKLIKGFIPQNWMPKNIGADEVLKQLSTYDLDIYAGEERDFYKITTDYKGSVKWSVSDKKTIDFDETTGKVKGLKPGTATISATVGEKTLTCTVHSIYKWPLEWTGAARQSTYVYKAIGTSYQKTSTELSQGDSFTVKGDMGNDDGWAYGYATLNGKTYPGYIPISHISTKGTISQYNSLNWIWPVNDSEQVTKAKYITSPYGWRDTNPAQHKGIDITNGISSNSDFANSIDGYEVVSAFAGKVIFVHDNSTEYKSCGNCVAIRSNEKDLITGKYFVAIYMHLKSKPSVRENQNVPVNKLLGYVGNTGNSGGSHLHFEVNNQNLSYGQKIYCESNSNKEMVFGSVINPIFFYMDYHNLPNKDPEKIIVNPDCDAMNYRKPLWYGDDIKESKKP